MSGIARKLSGECTINIQEMTEALKKELDAELILDSCKEINGVTISKLVFEKYYFRNNNYASLTIVISEFNGKLIAEIAATGGGEGLFNISWGANRDFGDQAANILMRYKLKDI